MDYAENYLGPTHMMTKNMTEVYKTAKEKIEVAKDKQGGRHVLPSEFTGSDNDGYFLKFF